MKKFILGIITAIIVSACVCVDAKAPEMATPSAVQKIKLDGGIYKIIIEGHEYLKFTEAVYYGYSVSVIHSASCPANHDNWNGKN